MAAALQSCGGFVPSPTTRPSSRRPTSMSPTIVAVPTSGGRRFFPGLKLQQAPGITSAFLRPRVVVVQAQKNGGRHAQRPRRPQPAAGDRHFAEERDHVMERYACIIDMDDGCLYMEASAMSAQVCLSANEALEIASRIMEAAYLNVDAAAALNDDGEISTHTVYRTLMDYVDTFVDAADAAYDRTVTRKTVTSFLGALRGLASISHILLGSSLEALAHTHVREGLSEYAYNCDVKEMQREFNRRMDDLECGIRNTASDVKVCKLAVPAIQEGMKATGSFVGLMVARHKRVVGKAHLSIAMQ